MTLGRVSEDENEHMEPCTVAPSRQSVAGRVSDILPWPASSSPALTQAILRFAMGLAGM